VANVLTKPTLQAFWERHRDAQKELEAWFKVARKARWTSLADVRAPFPTADMVGQCLIFNICRNKYRLIVSANRSMTRLFVKHILTHKDYDRNEWKKDCIR